MADDILVLLPPSEGKSDGGHEPRWSPRSGRFAELLGERRATVAGALAKAGGGDQALLGVGGKHLDRARAANRELVGAPTLPAGERYTGVVWDHLDLASLTKAQRTRAADAIVVVSGLLGLVGVDDPVPDYRLKMNVALARLGKLSTWWRPAVTEAIDQAAAGRFVIDLLPIEHRAAWAVDASVANGVEGVSVAFVERSGKVAGHDAKAAKGRLARHLLTSRAGALKALSSWRDDRFDLTITPFG